MATETFPKDREHHFIIPFDTTLRDVVEKDLLPTLMLLRESYDPYFVPNQMNELLRSLEWLKEDEKHLKKFERSDFGANGNGMPDFLVHYRFSLKLFFELRYDIKRDRLDKILDIPVTYSHKSKHYLERYLEDITYDQWLKIRKDPTIRTPDELCVSLFKYYWGKLEERAKEKYEEKTQGNPQVK